MARKYRLLWPQKVTLPTGEQRWLHRIKATRDIPLFDVYKGDLGGYVSSKHVLSQYGSCWIADNAIAEERLTGDFMGPLRKSTTNREFLIQGSSILTGNAYVVASTVNNAEIRDNAIVRSSVIGDDVQIYDNAKVMRSNLMGDVEVNGGVVVDDARISGKVRLHDKAELFNVVMKSDGFIGVFNNAKVEGAYMAADHDSVIMVSENARVAKQNEQKAHFFTGTDTRIEIDGDATVFGGSIVGNFSVADKSIINSANISGDTTFIGPVVVAENCVFKGKTHAVGPVKFESGEYVDGARSLPQNTKQGNAKKPVAAPKQKSITGTVITPDPMLLAIKGLTEGVTNNAKSAQAVTASQRYVDIINETLDEYQAYTTDLIKLIKYPAMADASVIETQHLLVAIKRAKRAMNYPEEIESLKTASEALEQSFVIAENRAKAVAAEYLDDKKKSNLKKAGDLIAIACNDAATEQEKKSSVKATLNTLTGIFEVSDAAVENLKMKVGILELEA